MMTKVMKAISKANGLCTATAEGSWGRFRKWEADCKAATGVVVIFSAVYRDNFTVAMQNEANVILKLRHAKRTKLYILDPGLHSENDLRVNIIDKSGGGMGDISAWVKFVTPRLWGVSVGENLNAEDTNNTGSGSGSGFSVGCPGEDAVAPNASDDPNDGSIVPVSGFKLPPRLVPSFKLPPLPSTKAGGCIQGPQLAPIVTALPRIAETEDNLPERRKALAHLAASPRVTNTSRMANQLPSLPQQDHSRGGEEVEDDLLERLKALRDLAIASQITNTSRLANQGLPSRPQTYTREGEGVEDDLLKRLRVLQLPTGTGSLRCK